MKKLYLLLMFSVFLFSFTSAYTLGSFEQGVSFNVTESCSSCDSVTITSITSDTGTLVLSNTAMNKDGSFFYYPQIIFNIGKYHVSGYGTDSDGNKEEFNYDLYIQKNGFLGLNFHSSNGWVVIAVLLLLSIAGFFIGKSPQFSGTMLSLLGLLLWYNGFYSIAGIFLFVIGLIMLFGGKR